jgi:dihydroorotate dehydrogenase (fumarate)
MDLTTRYLGLQLGCPIIAGASPLTAEPDNIKRLEDLGAGAVVMPSVFEEQIVHEEALLDQIMTTGAYSQAEAAGYFPTTTSHAAGTGHYLEKLRRAAAAVDIPVIASLNGTTDSGWTSYASQMEQAGASALELNIFFIPADLTLSGSDVEQRYLAILTAVKHAVNIPVAVKIGPYFSAIGDMARRLVGAGADGLVLFNRFYEPDIDLARLAVLPNLELSTPSEIRLPLLWIGILAGNLRASLAATTGVDRAAEVVKYLLAGADAVMTTSALLHHGIAHMQTLRGGLTDWLAARDIDTVARIRGSMSHRNIPDASAFERANYVRILQGYR